MSNIYCAWGVEMGSENAQNFEKIYTSAVEDLEKFLVPTGNIDEEIYRSWRNAIGVLEMDYEKNSENFDTEKWKELLRKWISANIKIGDILNAKNYTKYFDADDWQNIKITALEKIRLLVNPEQQLEANQHSLFEILVLAYEKYPEKLENIISLWVEYLDKIFTYPIFQKSILKKSFLGRVVKNPTFEPLYRKMEEHDGYQGFLAWNVEKDRERRHEFMMESADESEKMIQDYYENIEDKNDTSPEAEQLRELVKILQADIEKMKKELQEAREENEKLKNTNIVSSDSITNISQKNSIHRSEYRIGLIFGAPKSVKNFKKENVDKNQVYIAWGLSKENFEILEEDFESQRRLSMTQIQNRFYGLTNRPLHFVIVFELDHETELNSMVNSDEFRNKFVVSQKDGQHYSKAEFARLLEEGITRFERENENTNA